MESWIIVYRLLRDNGERGTYELWARSSAEALLKWRRRENAADYVVTSITPWCINWREETKNA